jgi:2OG-Fe(II) oxygenase superfamily
MLIELMQWQHAPEHKAALLALVADRQAAVPDTSLGVAHPQSWSSDKRLFESVTTQPLEAWIRETLLRRTATTIRDVSAWANVLTAGQYIGPHAHEQSHLGGPNAYAGVYYVQAGGPGGVLSLHHPSGSKIRELQLVPREGMLVVFTADTLHEVTAHESAIARVSIAFNVRVEAR